MSGVRLRLEGLTYDRLGKWDAPAKPVGGRDRLPGELRKILRPRGAAGYMVEPQQMAGAPVRQQQAAAPGFLSSSRTSSWRRCSG